MPCAHCNKPGHNKRTCPFLSEEMVAEEVVNVEEKVENKELVLELEEGVNEDDFNFSEEEEEEEGEDMSHFAEDFDLEEEEEEGLITGYKVLLEEQDEEDWLDLVREETELYEKNGYNEEGKLVEVVEVKKKKRGRPKGSKNKVVEVVEVKKKKRGRPKVEVVEKKKRGRPKGSKNKVQKPKKRKTMDIDTSGLKITRSIAEIIASTGRIIDAEYIMD